ncbi:hypothetical protein OQA88_1729 [Cercophora sp. LCS_1]
MGPLGQLTLLVAALCPTLVASEAPASLPKITDITFSGSGCPSDGGVKVAGGFDSLSVTFKEFSAKLPGNKTLNCQAHVQGSGGSPGWQFKLKEATVYGRAYLQPETRLSYFHTVYFSQNAANTVRPVSATYRRRFLTLLYQKTQQGELENSGAASINKDVILYSDLSASNVWSPCPGADGYTGIFNINFRGALDGEAGKASFVAKSQKLGFEWRKC